MNTIPWNKRRNLYGTFLSPMRLGYWVYMSTVLKFSGPLDIGLYSYIEMPFVLSSITSSIKHFDIPFALCHKPQFNLPWFSLFLPDCTKKPEIFSSCFYTKFNVVLQTTDVTKADRCLLDFLVLFYSIILSKKFHFLHLFIRLVTDFCTSLPSVFLSYEIFNSYYLIYC